MTRKLKRLYLLSSVRVMAVSMATAFIFIVQQSLELLLLSLPSLLQHISRSLRPPTSLAPTDLSVRQCGTRLYDHNTFVSTRGALVFISRHLSRPSKQRFVAGHTDGAASGRLPRRRLCPTSCDLSRVHKTRPTKAIDVSTVALSRSHPAAGTDPDQALGDVAGNFDASTAD